MTCEAVLTEAYHLLGRVPRARAAMRKWIGLGRVTTPLRFDEQAEEVMHLLEQYADQPMDLADACVVRLAELVALAPRNLEAARELFEPIAKPVRAGISRPPPVSNQRFQE